MSNLPTTPKTSSYILGFGLALILTLVAYLLAVGGHFHGWAITFVLAGLALLQLLVQLVFFLHIREESRPRWKLIALGFAVIVVVILVFGSLWIMVNLSYHHDHNSPTDVNNYLIQDEGFQP